MYFIRGPVRIHDNNLAGHVHEQFDVGPIEPLQIVECNALLVSRLVPPLDVLEAPLGALGQVDEKVRTPCELLVELIVRLILLRRHQTLFLHHLPKDPPGAHEGSLQKDQGRAFPRWLVGQEDAAM